MNKNSGNNKQVLMIAYGFPPAAGSGVIRTLKFVKYLPEFDWMPSVLTLKDNHWQKKDASMLKEVPDNVIVIKTGMFDLTAFLARCKRKIINLLFFLKNNSEAEIAKTSKRLAQSGKMFKEKQRRLRDLLMIPDRFNGWFIPAVFAGLFFLRRKKIDCLYSTSPCATAHLIALILKFFFRKPWIADFRDPWTLMYDPGLVYKQKIAVENWLERKVISGADKIIANTEYLKDLYLKKYGENYRSKFIVITNGYDESDFQKIDLGRKRGREKIVISHIGEFYHTIRTPDNFLKAIAELIKEMVINKNRIEIRFVGAGEYVLTEHFKGLLKGLNLVDNVVILGHVRHKESVWHMFDSDILLLLQPSERTHTQIPAKAFEYIRTGLPILVLAPEGATADLLNKIKYGAVVEPNNISAIKNEIYNKVLKLEKGTFKTCLDLAQISKYDRKNLTKDLSAVFNQLV